MRLKPQELVINSDSPFKDDLLERKQTAESLTQLVINENDGIVIALHAPWGFGKTTFLQMWLKHLEPLAIKTMYFNAWENDFSDNALVALIGELSSKLEELKSDDKNNNTAQLTQSLDKIKRIGANILKQSIPIGVRIASQGLINISPGSEAALGDLGEKIAEEQIKDYEESKKSIGEFKKSLAEYTKELTENSDETLHPPLVIVVDDLDRCRPDYAVRILESIKHLFVVKNICFIVAIDRDQMSQSIKKMYGLDADSIGYLRRFFDIELMLPKPDSKKFTATQIARFGLKEVFEHRRKLHSHDDGNTISEFFNSLFKFFNCSLRDQERAFTLLSLALRSTPNNYYIFPELLSLLIILKIREPSLYKEFTDNPETYETILKRICSSTDGNAFILSRPGIFLEAMLIACNTPYHRKEQIIGKFITIEASRTLSQRESDLTHILSQHWFSDNYNCLNYTAQKIDLFSSDIRE